MSDNNLQKAGIGMDLTKQEKKEQKKREKEEKKAESGKQDAYGPGEEEKNYQEERIWRGGRSLCAVHRSFQYFQSECKTGGLYVFGYQRGY